MAALFTAVGLAIGSGSEGLGLPRKVGLVRKAITYIIGISIALPVSAYGNVACGPSPEGSVSKKKDVVRNEIVAEKIGLHVFMGIYGGDNIRRQLPLIIKDKGSFYHIRGRLPKGYAGGVAEMNLCKSNSQITFLNHGK